MSAKRGRFDYAFKSEEMEAPEVLAEEEVLALLAVNAHAAQSGSAAHALQVPEAYALPPQKKGKKAKPGEVRRTDLPREQLNVRIRPELKRAAAGLAGLHGLTLGDVVEAALIDYIQKSRES